MRITEHKNAEVQSQWSPDGKEKMSVVALQFESRFDMANWIERTPNPNPTDFNSSVTGSEEWTGTKSLEEAMDMLKYGDPARGKELAKTRDSLHIKSGTTDVSNSYHSNTPERGPTLDIGRFVQDDPDMWMNHRTRVIEGRGHRLARVFINVSVSCNVSAKDIFRRMVNVSTAVKELKQAGYSVGLYAGELVSTRKRSKGFHRVETSVKISEWGHVVPDHILAFIAGNPSFLRRIMFACNERSGYMEDIDFGYGGPVGGYATPTFEKFDICFNLANDMTPETGKIIEDLKK